MSDKASLPGRTPTPAEKATEMPFRGYADQPISRCSEAFLPDSGRNFHGVTHQLPIFGNMWARVAFSLHSARGLSPIVRAFQRIHVLAPAAPAEALLDSPPGRRPRLAVHSRLSGLDHPYFRLMHRALESCGISIAGNVEIGVSWLRSNRRSIDAVHFHWPETIWRDRRKGTTIRRRTDPARRPGRCCRVARFLREAHRLGDCLRLDHPQPRTPRRRLAVGSARIPAFRPFGRHRREP